MDTDENEARVLGGRIRDEARYHAAPPGLAARVLAALPQDTVPADANTGRRWNPWKFGAALATAFALVMAVALYLVFPASEQRLADEVVASHVRSLMVDHASDVASSDHHTVKPWFAGKLDFSPPVVDLTAQGFSLLGGRLDYLDHRPVAALVYRHRQHLINLFIWPAPGESAAQAREVQGYNISKWRRAGMEFWAVSDLNPEELAQFRERLLKAPG